MNAASGSCLYLLGLMLMVPRMLSTPQRKSVLRYWFILPPEVLVSEVIGSYFGLGSPLPNSIPRSFVTKTKNARNPGYITHFSPIML